MKNHNLILFLFFFISCGGAEESTDTCLDQDILLNETELSDTGIDTGDDSFQLIDPNKYFDTSESGTDLEGFEMFEPEPPSNVTYLILCVDSLEESAIKFKEYREIAGNYVVYLVKMSDMFPAGNPFKDIYHKVIKETIKKVYDKRDKSRAFYVLLLGDSNGDYYSGNNLIPPASFGVVNTDNFYADLNDDDIPDFAIGRIPVRTKEEADVVLDKIKKHESEYKTGLFNRKMNVYTGQGNFGSMIDTLIEEAMKIGAEKISYDFDMTMTYNKQDSPYYYVPFDDKVVELYNEGPLLTSYIGHGSEEGMEGLNTTMISNINSPNRLPLSAFFACFTGNFDGKEDGVSEKLFKKSGASVAILASSEISHPYGNAILGYEFERVLLDIRPETFGEVVRMSKDAIFTNSDDFRQLIDTVGSVILSEKEISDLKVSHEYLYNLIGDPATKTNLPQGKIALTIDPDPVNKGGTFYVSGIVDNVISGQVYITMESERSTILGELNVVKDPEKEKELVNKNWETANNKVIYAQTVPVSNNEFISEISLADFEFVGVFYIKAYADDSKVDAVGSKVFTIQNVIE